MKYFSISEMLKSDTAIKQRLWNGAPKEAEENLRALVDEVLDPLREAYGRPIRVNSGYRCPKLNNLVGGTPNSTCAAKRRTYSPSSATRPTFLNWPASSSKTASSTS